MTAPTREQAEAAFAPADLTRVGDLLVDDETGEILEWPAGVEPEGRLEWLQAQHAESLEQEKRHAQAKGVYARAIGGYLDRMGAKTYAGGAFKSTAIGSSMVRSAPAEQLRELVSLEAMPERAALDLMWLLAKDLDVDRIAQAARDGKIPRPVAEHLIILSPRAGYVRTDKVAKAAPEITKESSRDHE